LLLLVRKPQFYCTFSFYRARPGLWCNQNAPKHNSTRLGSNKPPPPELIDVLVDNHSSTLLKKLQSPSVAIFNSTEETPCRYTFYTSLKLLQKTQPSCTLYLPLRTPGTQHSSPQLKNNLQLRRRPEPEPTDITFYASLKLMQKTQPYCMLYLPHMHPELAGCFNRGGVAILRSNLNQEPHPYQSLFLPCHALRESTQKPVLASDTPCLV